MLASRAWGVPHSELLGRVQRDGQPRWTERDRALAIALKVYEDGKHECGQPIVEAFAADNEDSYEATAMRCHACATAQKFGKGFEGDTEGLTISIRKVD